LIAKAQEWSDFLTKLDEDEKLLWAERAAQDKRYRECPSLITYLDDIPTISKVMLREIVLHNLSVLDNDMDKMGYADELLTAFKALKPTHCRRETRAPQPRSHTDLVKGFNETYGDQHNLVTEYSKMLRQYMNAWMTSRMLWNTPYISLVNSSMTGKTRFQKQLALHDPVIFFCLSPEDHSGYPKSVLPWVWKALSNPFKISKCYPPGVLSDSHHDDIEDAGVTGHLYFFRFVLERLLDLVLSPEWKDKTKLEKREYLWY
jgi:hypothetical protein